MLAALDFLMTEHPAWVPSHPAPQRVLRKGDGSLWLAQSNGTTTAVHTSSTDAPTPDLFALNSPQGSPDRDVPQLQSAVTGLGTVGRFRNNNLWDAIGLAIIRQVIRAGQSKKMYRAFCAAHGEHVQVSAAEYALFPSPETVLKLTADQFSVLGMAFKRRPLQAAAEAFLASGAEWTRLAAPDLIVALQDVSRIGPWTAGAAVADYTNDWSLYPYADLAVRTWAARAAPSYDWPQDEDAFSQLWRHLAGNQLSTLTLLTLAWGSRHGDIG